MPPAALVAATPLSDIAARAEEWTLSVNGQSIPLVGVPNPASGHKPIAGGLLYAHVVGEGAFAVELTVPVRSGLIKIHPRRTKLAVNSKKLRHQYIHTFTVPPGGPSYLVLDFVEDLSVVLLLEPADAGWPPAEKRVAGAELGLAPDTGADLTEAFAKAGAALSGTGKTLVLSAGVYRLQTVYWKDVVDCGLHLAPGALLQIEPAPPGSERKNHGLFLENCARVKISGRGTLDHGAYETFTLNNNAYFHGLEHTAHNTPEAIVRGPWFSQSPVFLLRCADVELEGLVVRNGRFWDVTTHMCDRLVFRRVKVLTPPACTPEWTDGFAIGGSRDVLIEDCFAFCNDDTIAAAAYPTIVNTRGSGNVTVRRFFGYTRRASCVRLGWDEHWQVKSDFGDFTFEDSDFVANSLGLRIHAREYGTISIRNCDFRMHQSGGGIRSEGSIAKLELIDTELPGKSSLLRVHELRLQRSTAAGQPLVAGPDFRIEHRK